MLPGLFRLRTCVLLCYSFSFAAYSVNYHKAPALPCKADALFSFIVSWALPNFLYLRVYVNKCFTVFNMFFTHCAYSYTRRFCALYVSVFGFYFCFLFLLTTVVQPTAPPLIKSSAIHSMRLLLLPVLGDFCSLAVTVSAFLISFIPSRSL